MRRYNSLNSKLMKIHSALRSSLLLECKSLVKLYLTFSSPQASDESDDDLHLLQHQYHLYSLITQNHSPSVIKVGRLWANKSNQGLGTRGLDMDCVHFFFPYPSNCHFNSFCPVIQFALES